MDASSVALDLFHNGIIPDGALESIQNAHGQRHRNSILHDYLLRTCTDESLMTACGIITSVQGNPRMSALGKDAAEAGVRCVCMVCTCVCVCVCLI